MFYKTDRHDKEKKRGNVEKKTQGLRSTIHVEMIHMFYESLGTPRGRENPPL